MHEILIKSIIDAKLYYLPVLILKNCLRTFQAD